MPRQAGNDRGEPPHRYGCCIRHTTLQSARSLRRRAQILPLDTGSDADVGDRATA
jgi:hypothetical protein